MSKIDLYKGDCLEVMDKLLENRIFVQQGTLLVTRATKRLNKEEFNRANYEEKRRIFINFSPFDGGKSREFIMCCDTPDEAKKIVQKHNNVVIKRIEDTATQKGLFN